MKVKELRELLDKFDDEQDIQLNIEDGYEVTVCENLMQETCYADLVLYVSLPDSKYVACKEDSDD